MTVMDPEIRSALFHGLITNQIAVSDDTAHITERASPQFIRKIATTLRTPIFLRPDTSIRDFSREQSLIDAEIYISIRQILAELKAAKQKIDGKYADTSSLLGNPVGRVQYAAKDGFYQEYERGAIYLSPTGVVHEVHGAIYRKYKALKAEAGFLGYPETDEQNTTLGTGQFNHFQGGSIYCSSQTGAWEIHGPIRDQWWQQDGDRSSLGFPISDVEDWTDDQGTAFGRVSHFQNGMLGVRWSDAIVQKFPNSYFHSASLDNGLVKGSYSFSMNSSGDWHFAGHMHNDGFAGCVATMVTALQFLNGAGQTFAVTAERSLGGTLDEESRDDDWDQSGSGVQFIRDNWESISAAGVRAVLRSDTTLGDVLAVAIPVGLVLAAIIGVATGGRVCPPQGSFKRDPFTGQDNPSVTFEVVPDGADCPRPYGP